MVFKANLLNFKATTTEERTLLQPENKDSKYFFKCNISLPWSASQQAILIKAKDIWIDTRQAKRLCNRSSRWPPPNLPALPAHPAPSHPIQSTPEQTRSTGVQSQEASPSLCSKLHRINFH